MLEGAIKREHLFSEFETTDELLGSLSRSRHIAADSTCLETITMLPWVPLTTAAVALRVMEFDAAIFYVLQQKLESHKDRGSGNVIVSFLLFIYLFLIKKKSNLVVLLTSCNLWRQDNSSILLGRSHEESNSGTHGSKLWALNY